MPLKIENTLNNYKVSLLGKNPRDRGSYDPSPVLSNGGEKVLVEDSHNLPPDWKDHDLRDIMKMMDPVPAGGDGTNDEVYILKCITVIC